MTAFTGGMQVRYTGLTTADCDLIKAQQTEWVRVTIDMGTALGGGHAGSPLTGINYSMGGVETVINYAHSIGLKVLACITYSPGWMRPSGVDKQIPIGALADDWAAGAAAVVTHYGANIDAVEIWNEPNHDPFNRMPDLATIRPFMRKAILAIRAARPSLIIMAGGCASARTRTGVRNPKWDDRTPAAGPTDLSLSPATYLDGLYESGGIVAGTTPGTPYVDAVAIHGYTGNLNPTTPWNSGRFENPLIHAFLDMPNIGSVASFGSAGFNYRDDILVQRGDGTKKIWQTEGGFYGGYPTLSEGDANNFMVIALAEWRDQQLAGFAGPYFYFELRDNKKTNADGSKETTNSEDYLGLYFKNPDSSYRPKAQLSAWLALNADDVIVVPPSGEFVGYGADGQDLTYGQLFGSGDGTYGDYGEQLFVEPPPPPPPEEPPPGPPPTGASWTAALTDRPELVLGVAPYIWEKDGPELLGWDGVRSSDTPNPSGDGLLSANADYMTERNIDLPISIDEHDPVGALNAQEALAAVWQRSKGMKALILTTPVGTFYAYGRPRRLFTGITDVHQGWIDIRARFVATDPLFYSPEKAIIGQLATDEGGVEFPITFPFTFGPPNIGGVTVRNDGNTDTKRIVSIITAGPGGVNHPRLVLVTTGEVLELNLNLSEGQELWIDHLAETVKLNNQVSRGGKLVRPTSSFWSLPPGEHEITFDGTGLAEVETRYQSAWVR